MEAKYRSLMSELNAISVATDNWTIEHRVFAHDVYVENGESIVTM